jgi:competence protein ComEA
VNLAAWLEDGKQIEVPSKVVASNTDRTRDNSHHVAAVADDSTLPRPATRTKRLSTQRSTSRRASTSLQSTLKPSAPVPSQAAVPDRPIDLNRANSEDLELLPGIGPAIAARIVQYREENGDFATVDELDEVKGIGEKKLEKLRPFVFVR